MMARRHKQMFSTFAGPLMRANRAFYRAVLAPRGDEVVRVRLGPGQKN